MTAVVIFNSTKEWKHTEHSHSSLLDQRFFAPQGLFRRVAGLPVVDFRLCWGTRFVMLPERMVGIAARPICFQDSGQLWEWVSCSGFRGDIACQSPLAWSDRGRPPGTYTVCNVSNPGWTARWGYDGATRSPRRPAGLSTTPTPWFVSLPAITHCLPVTCATTWDRPGTHKGWRWEPDPGIPVKKNYRTTVPIPLASSRSLRAPCRARLDLHVVACESG